MADGPRAESKGVGMAAISFHRIVSAFTVLNPFKSIQEEVHRVVVRKDPLLGDVSIYNPYLKDKAKFFSGATRRFFIPFDIANISERF